VRGRARKGLLGIPAQVVVPDVFAEIAALHQQGRLLAGTA
jgi:hypothetical protein